jgi:threonine/homoserine/homoserine lactone efflux protein
MIDLSLFVAFVAATVVLCLTPGPDMMFIVAISGRHGSPAGARAACGVAAGSLVHAIATAFGLAALFTRAPVAFEVLRWAGAAFLLWLALQAFRERGDPSDIDATDGGAAVRDGERSRFLVQGLTTNLLNPKVIVFNVAFLPQFTREDVGSVTVQLLVLGLTLTLIGFLIDFGIALLAGRLSERLRGTNRAARTLNVVSGVVLAGLAAHLVASS